MAFEFLPPEINWSTHCGDAPTFGRFSTMFDYPTKAITQASVYPKEACQPWLHYNMRLGNLAVDTNLQVGATGVYGGNVTAPTFIGNLIGNVTGRASDNKSFDIPKNQIIGMGGILDSSRFKTYISRLTNYNQHDIDAMVIGGHGDTTMIPLTSISKCNNKLLSEIVSQDILQKISADTMVGGATLTKLLGTSAWYAPGASVSYLVNAIVNDTKEILPCSVYLEGEYNSEDICIGVPAIIGKNGFEEVINLDINKNEIEENLLPYMLFCFKKCNWTSCSFKIFLKPFSCLINLTFFLLADINKSPANPRA